MTIGLKLGNLHKAFGCPYARSSEKSSCHFLYLLSGYPASSSKSIPVIELYFSIPDVSDVWTKCSLPLPLIAKSSSVAPERRRLSLPKQASLATGSASIGQGCRQDG